MAIECERERDDLEISYKEWSGNSSVVPCKGERPLILGPTFFSPFSFFRQGPQGQDLLCTWMNSRL